jgi:hypothetical protein
MKAQIRASQRWHLVGNGPLRQPPSNLSFSGLLLVPEFLQDLPHVVGVAA